jgi:DNA repair protein RecO (recombination protein O)
MLHTTRAIVLKTIRHGDRTVVLKAFTEQFGLRSYMVRAGGKGGVANAALQALNRLELVVNEHAERDIQNIREMRVDRPYARIPYDPVRGALLLFTQELLYKVLRGEAADPELFGFLEEALEAIDSAEDVRNFPLVLLVQLSGQLGFQPAFPAPGEDRFDLREGEFVQGAVQHGHTMGPVLSGHLAALLPIGFEHMPGPVIPASERRDLLDHLLLYYRMHVEGLGELRSPAVLHQVLG